MSDELAVTPIGTSPAWYNPGEPASGTLVEVDGFRLLVDCGSGVIARYVDRWAPALPIDAIVITHAHPDHTFDLVPLKYGLLYGALGWDAPQLWLPPGGHGRLQRLAQSFDGGEDFFTESFDLRTYHPRTTVSIGPFDLRTREVPHYIESWALRLDHARGSIAFSGDMGPDDGIVELVRGVDLFICEAGAPAGTEPPPDAGHLPPELAGRYAREARAGELMINHVPAELGLERQVDVARACFGGPTVAAMPMVRHVVGGHARRPG